MTALDRFLSDCVNDCVDPGWRDNPTEATDALSIAVAGVASLPIGDGWFGGDVTVDWSTAPDRIVVFATLTGLSFLPFGGPR